MGFPSQMTRAARDTLKALIRQNPNLRAAETATGILVRDATKLQLEILCNALGIDAEKALSDHYVALVKAKIAASGAAAPAPAPAPAGHNSEQANETMTADETMSDEIETMTADETMSDETMTDESGEESLATLARGVLAPVKAFAAPAILQALESNLQALCNAADRRIIEAGLQAVPAAPAAPGSITSKRLGKSTIAKAFGFTSKDWGHLPVTLWSAKTETVDRGYIYNPDVLGPVMASVERNSGVWLYGAKGSGKTELARQVAACTGRPFTRISMADDMDKYALIGQRVPGAEGEGFVWRDGVLTAALRVPGMLILIDEVTASKPGFLFMLQTSIDLRRMTIEETGEVVGFADGVTFIAADNTDGYGDVTGRYSGTGLMNEAFLDRFPRKCLMETASNATLSRIIVNRTGLPSGAADMLANLIKTSEAMAVSGKLSTHLSLRPVLLFAADVRDRLPLNRCIETSILSALPASEMQAMRQHVLAHLDLVRLAAVAAPVPAAPAASAGLSDAALKAEMETMAHMTSAARDFAGR